MLDIKFIVENSSEVKNNLKKRFKEDQIWMVDELIQDYDGFKLLKKEIDDLRSERNKLSKEINKLKKEKKKADKEIKTAAKIPSKIKELEQEQVEIEKEEGQQELTTPPEEYEKEKPNKYTAARTAVKTEKSKFGIETIRVNDMGVYEINIDALMKGKPVVVLSKGGSYIISLPSVFGKESGVMITE